MKVKGCRGCPFLTYEASSLSTWCQAPGDSNPETMERFDVWPGTRTRTIAPEDCPLRSGAITVSIEE